MDKSRRDVTICSRGRQTPVGWRLSLPQLPASVAIYPVVLHHSLRLRAGVADGRPDEAEVALEQVFAHGRGLGRAGRQALQRLPPVDFHEAPGELPDILVKAAELLAHLQKGLGVADGGVDLQAVADNALV